MTHEYSVVIERDSAGYYIASVPSLPGCRTRGSHHFLRHPLTLLVQRRFGADVAQDSEPLIARIVDPQRLDDLHEFALDSPDAEAWLAALGQAAE